MRTVLLGVVLLVVTAARGLQGQGDQFGCGLAQFSGAAGQVQAGAFVAVYAGGGAEPPVAEACFGGLFEVYGCGHGGLSHDFAQRIGPFLRW